MKIKRPPKKQPSSNPSIAAFISSLATAKDDDLPELLESVLAVGWTWPRTDLQHWINPLNRFDTILDGVVTDYDLATLDHPQTNQFTPRTKRTLLAILRFEKLLLENSTNRKIFASFDVSSRCSVWGGWEGGRLSRLDKFKLNTQNTNCSHKSHYVKMQG